MENIAAQPDRLADLAELRGLVEKCVNIFPKISALAPARDRDDAFPDREIALLGDAGLILAPFPRELDGVGLGSTSGEGRIVLDLLRRLGAASLSLGRLYEGHVNAVSLVIRYGSRANLALLHEEALAGRITGVWMAEAEPGLSLDAVPQGTLNGAKIFCSGAGHVRRPLVAARMEGTAGPQMLIPNVPRGDRASTANWRALGMKATATGDVDFTGLRVSPDEIVGAPNDYFQSPYFRGGAWRVLAVQLGGLDALLELYRAGLGPDRACDAVQLARFGEAVTEVETARLWVEQAASIVDRHEQTDGDPIAVDAVVDLARGAFERAAQALMQRIERGLGLRALIAPNPIERIIRDLTTYLRQPALDLSLAAAAEFVLRGGALYLDRH